MTMKVLEILKRTEEEIREAMAEAARAGEYRDVDICRGVAVNIKELCERISGNGIKSSRAAEERGAYKQKRAKESFQTR